MREIKLPRLQTSITPVFPTNFNQAMDVLEKELNDVLKEIGYVNKRLDDFYSKLIGIFSIFVAIFSLIITSTQNLIFSRGRGVWETAWNSLGYMLPLTAVLLIFILVLNKVRKS